MTCGVLREFLLLSLVAAAGLSGCAPYWEQNSLKDKIKELEDRVKSLEATKAKSEQANAERRQALETCVIVDAEEVYWRYIRLNGKSLVGGSYQAPRYVWDEARKRKLDKIEECKLLFSASR